MIDDGVKMFLPWEVSSRWSVLALGRGPPQAGINVSPQDALLKWARLIIEEEGENDRRENGHTQSQKEGNKNKITRQG